MTPENLTALERAVRSLEHPGFAARLTNMVGKPIELVGNVLPTSARRVIATATSKALQAALKVALRTLPRGRHAGESGYFAVRAMLAKSVTEAARFIAERGIIEEGAPVLVRFTTLVASRFGVVVSQKFAAQALPVVGALGGASVNYVFIEHFQEIAQGHFTVRRLERVYGKDVVRAEYERLAKATEPQAT
jgi:hypothetical protein